MWFVLRAGMPLPFLKCKISSHDGMQLTGMSMSSHLFCCTGMTYWGTHKKQLSLLTLPCLLLYILSVCSSFFPQHHPGAPFLPRKRTKLSRSIPEVHDSVSLAQVSNTSCASQPPSSDPGAGLHLRVNQPPSSLALCPTNCFQAFGGLVATGVPQWCLSALPCQPR